MGTVVQFPHCAGAQQFTAEMRSSLAYFAAQTPSAQPLLFGTDDDGSEFCRLADSLIIGWDRRRRLILTDATSGYVDRGPFHNLDEVCLLFAYLWPEVTE